MGTRSNLQELKELVPLLELLYAELDVHPDAQEEQTWVCVIPV
jgi:hypothetical protein